MTRVASTCASTALAAAAVVVSALSIDGLLTAQYLAVQLTALAVSVTLFGLIHRAHRHGHDGTGDMLAVVLLALAIAVTAFRSLTVLVLLAAGQASATTPFGA